MAILNFMFAFKNLKYTMEVCMSLYEIKNRHNSINYKKKRQNVITTLTTFMLIGGYDDFSIILSTRKGNYFIIVHVCS